MRVCLLTQTFPRFPGDTAAPFMDGVARGIAKAGNEVFVLTPFSPKFKLGSRNLAYKLVTYKYIFPDSLHLLGYAGTLKDDKWLKFTSFLLSPFLCIAGVLALYRLVEKEKIDIINAHWILPNGFLAAIVSLVMGVPVVSTLPGSDVFMAQKNFFYGLLAKFAVRFSKIITSNSPQLLSDLQKVTKENVLGKSQVIIYGVDPSKFKKEPSHTTRLKESLGIGNKEKVVLGVGRLVAKKGFEYLISGAPKILAKHKNTTFVIAGDGEQKERLVSLARRLEVFDKFRFVGKIDYSNLLFYYNLSDVFVLPSIRDEEGNLDDQSVSVVEAMAVGVPVVTTDFPGYRIVVKDGVNGFLVRQRNVGEIVNAVNKIIGFPVLAKKMGEAGRELVKKEFSWEMIGRKYSQLFEKVIEKNKSYFENVTKMSDLKRRAAVGKQILSVLEKEMGPLTKLKCLDAAASCGVITNLLAGRFGQVVAIDIDKPALALARKTYNRENLKFIEMDAEKMEFSDNLFDVVICNQVYNFVENPKKLMSEVYRVIKPSGICFFGARNKISLIEPQYEVPLLSFFPKLLPFGKNYMNFWELKNLVKDFEVKDYTLEILRNPERYGYHGLLKYRQLARMIPEFLSPLVPNFIWVLRKR